MMEQMSQKTEFRFHWSKNNKRQIKRKGAELHVNIYQILKKKAALLKSDKTAEHPELSRLHATSFDEL